MLHFDTVDNTFSFRKVYPYKPLYLFQTTESNQNGKFSEQYKLIYSTVHSVSSSTSSAGQIQRNDEEKQSSVFVNLILHHSMKKPFKWIDEIDSLPNANGIKLSPKTISESHAFNVVN